MNRWENIVAAAVALAICACLYAGCKPGKVDKDAPARGLIVKIDRRLEVTPPPPPPPPVLKWVLQPTAGGALQVMHGMAYDAGRGVSVICGGWPPIGPSDGGTWEYDGTTWTENTTAGSPYRYANIRSRMAYDSERKVVVHVIVYEGTFLSEYDGTAWTRYDTSGPGHDLVLAYDSARKVTVLFEKAGDNGVTWLWDGVSLAKQSPVNSPPPRYNSAIAYDSHRKVAVIFGGDHLNDTWEWDGADWTKKEPEHKPPGRSWHTMAYDSARKVTVMFGGRCTHASVPTADTWEWDGTDWKEVVQTEENPPTGVFHTMVYDSRRERIVLFATWRSGDG